MFPKTSKSVNKRQFKVFVEPASPGDKTGENKLNATIHEGGPFRRMELSVNIEPETMKGGDARSPLSPKKRRKLIAEPNSPVVIKPGGYLHMMQNLSTQIER